MKKSNKILTWAVLSLVAFLIILSFKELIAIKFNKQTKIETKYTGIDCVEVYGPIYVALDSYEKMKYDINKPKVLDYENISTEIKNDTLKIFYNGPGKWPANTYNIIYYALSYNVPIIKYVKATSGAQVSIKCKQSGVVNLSSADSSKISWIASDNFETLNIISSGSSHVEIIHNNYLYAPNSYLKKVFEEQLNEKSRTNVQLNGKANLYLAVPNTIINGKIENKSYIRLAEKTINNYNINELSILDSAAVVYKPGFIRIIK